MAEENAVTKEDVRAVLEARADYYRMLSSFYYRPITQEEIDHMAASDFSELRAGKEDSILAEGFDDIFRYLRKRNTGTRQEMAADFTGVFAGAQTYEGHQALPYESLFRDPSGLLMRGPRNEVYLTFKQAAVELKDGLNLPEDHLSFEFEFIALECDRCVELLEKGDFKGCIDNLKLQQKFFELHIASWFDRFYALSMIMVQTRFYRGVLKITRGFLEDEPDEIAAQIEDVEALR